mmetsp:Transcript_48180/g.52116  ORF Transcript_48180/g.52116 Transcript_48180/m.52116 type:complete len:107 (+) Transcript_48180:158-478(+)
MLMLMILLIICHHCSSNSSSSSSSGRCYNIYRREPSLLLSLLRGFLLSNQKIHTSFPIQLGFYDFSAAAIPFVSWHTFRNSLASSSAARFHICPICLLPLLQIVVL